MTKRNSGDIDETSEPDDFTIREIVDIHGKLLQALVETSSLNLDVDDRAHVDLSFVQMIEAARLYAEQNGKTFLLSRPAGANVRSVLERGGFLTAPSPRFARFWLHEEIRA